MSHEHAKDGVGGGADAERGIADPDRSPEVDSESGPQQVEDFNVLLKLPPEQLDGEVALYADQWGRHTLAGWNAVMHLLPRVGALKYRSKTRDEFVKSVLTLTKRRIKATQAYDIIRHGLYKPEVLRLIWADVLSSAAKAEHHGEPFEYPTLGTMLKQYQPGDERDIKVPRPRGADADDDDADSEDSDKDADGVGGRSNDKRTAKTLRADNLRLEDQLRTLTSQMTALESKLAAKDRDLQEAWDTNGRLRDANSVLVTKITELVAQIANLNPPPEDDPPDPDPSEPPSEPPDLPEPDPPEPTSEPSDEREPYPSEPPPPEPPDASIQQKPTVGPQRLIGGAKLGGHLLNYANVARIRTYALLDTESEEHAQQCAEVLQTRKGPIFWLQVEDHMTLADVLALPAVLSKPMADALKHGRADTTPF